MMHINDIALEDKSMMWWPKDNTYSKSLHFISQQHAHDIILYWALS